MFSLHTWSLTQQHDWARHHLSLSVSVHPHRPGEGDGRLLSLSSLSQSPIVRYISLLLWLLWFTVMSSPGHNLTRSSPDKHSCVTDLSLHPRLCNLSRAPINQPLKSRFIRPASGYRPSTWGWRQQQVRDANIYSRNEAAPYWWDCRNEREYREMTNAVCAWLTILSVTPWRGSGGSRAV